MTTVDFSLYDQNGKLQTLSEYKGRWVVLYFYPKDDTPGCTKEACAFRDTKKLFNDKNVIILGVSKDSVQSHKKFAEKYHINFPILSDESKKVIKAYDAWGQKKFLGKAFEGTLRKSYLIDPAGKIKKVYNKVDPLNHASEILKDIELFGI